VTWGAPGRRGRGIVFTSIDGRQDIRAHRTRRPALQCLTEGEAVEIETAIADLLARESRRIRKRSHVDHFRERIAGLFVAGAERLGSPGDNVVPFRSAVTTARRVAEQVAARANSAVEFLAETWDRSANPASGAQAPIADAHVSLVPSARAPALPPCPATRAAYGSTSMTSAPRICSNGSVRFIKNTIQWQTWRALGTVDGGEVVSSDSY